MNNIYHIKHNMPQHKYYRWHMKDVSSFEVLNVKIPKYVIGPSEFVFKIETISDELVKITNFIYNRGSYYYPEVSVMLIKDTTTSSPVLNDFKFKHYYNHNFCLTICTEWLSSEKTLKVGYAFYNNKDKNFSKKAGNAIAKTRCLDFPLVINVPSIHEDYHIGYKLLDWLSLSKIVQDLEKDVNIYQVKFNRQSIEYVKLYEMVAYERLLSDVKEFFDMYVDKFFYNLEV